MIDNLYLNVGAMKAGTTWLYAHLENHPDIHFSLEKEVHYFAHVNTYHSPLSDNARLARFKQVIHDMNKGDGNIMGALEHIDWYRHYLAGPIDDSWYEGLFSKRISQRYFADFSNLNSHINSTGWDHIKGLARNLRVTYIMRHPLARLWSHVKFHTKITGEHEAMMNWSPEEFTNMVKKAFIWDNVEYSRVLRTLSENLDPEQYKIMFFEDIHADPLKALRDLEHFLQIRRHQFNQEALSQRVNVSTGLELPAAFRDQFLPELKDEVRKIVELGYDVPESWNDLLDINTA